MVNFGQLAAKIGWRVWGTPANFDGFRVLASLLHRRRSEEVNKTFRMFGCLLGWYTMYTFSTALTPNGILSGAKFTLRPSLAFSYIIRQFDSRTDSRALRAEYCIVSIPHNAAISFK